MLCIVYSNVIRDDRVVNPGDMSPVPNYSWVPCITAPTHTILPPPLPSSLYNVHCTHTTRHWYIVYSHVQGFRTSSDLHVTSIHTRGTRNTHIAANCDVIYRTSIRPPACLPLLIAPWHVTCCLGLGRSSQLLLRLSVTSLRVRAPGECWSLIG